MRIASMSIALAALFAAGMAQSSQASTIPINNSDFEVYNGSPMPVTTTANVYQWLSSTGNNSDNSWGQQNPGTGSGANGSNSYAYFWNTGNNQFMFQDLGTATAVGGIYTLTGYIKAIDAGTGGSVRLVAMSGGVPVSTLAVSPEVTNGTQWNLATATYTAATAGIQLGVELFRNNGSQHQNLFFDQIAATAEVPEPTSLALLGVVSGGLMLRRRRA